MKNGNRFFVYLIMGVIALAISSCSPGVLVPDNGGGQTPGSDYPLVNTRWLLVSIEEQSAETRVLDGTEVTLEFDDAGLAAGSGGCNTFSARYSQQDGEIVFGEIVTTERACTANGVMDQEQRYYQALQSAVSFGLNGDRLQIRYDDGALNFVSQSAQPTAAPQESADPLADTHWTLVSYGDPGSEIRAIQPAAPTLEFNSQGQAGGSGGCNAFGAPYSVSGQTLSFDQITSTLMLCESEDVGEQETEYFHALETAGRYELSDDSLTIWFDDDRRALNFVPAEDHPTETPTQSSALLCAERGEISANDWALCRSRAYGFEVRYPQDSGLVDQTESYARINLPIEPGTSLIEKYLEVSVTAPARVCSSQFKEGLDPEGTSSAPVNINGMEFLREVGGGVATGNIYDWVDYSISQEDVCINLGFVLHYFDPQNVATPPPEFDYQGETEVFEKIVATFRWLAPAPPAQTPATFQPTPIPERIEFQAGAISTEITGDLKASGSDLYVLYALEGQTMTVELSFAEGRAILAVWGEDGVVLQSDHAESSRFARELPDSQDYFILLKGQPGSSTEYTMKVTIPPR